jgi:urease gamma subunit
MRLSPRDREMLLVHVAADLAKKRLADAEERKRTNADNVDPHDFKLNYPEAMAIIISYVLEEARLGRQDVPQLECKAAQRLFSDQCMDGVPEMMRDLAVEATFPDGTKMVTLQKPIGRRVSVDPVSGSTPQNARV